MSKEHNALVKDITVNRKDHDHGKAIIISREGNLWRYINCEDLSTPKNFLLLLNSRGRKHPKLFVTEDGRAVEIAVMVIVISQPFISAYETVFDDRLDEPYAIVQCYAEGDSVLAQEAPRGMMAGAALIVLEIQENIIELFEI